MSLGIDIANDHLLRHRLIDFIEDDDAMLKLLVAHCKLRPGAHDDSLIQLREDTAVIPPFVFPEQDLFEEIVQCDNHDDPVWMDFNKALPEE